MDTNLFSQNPYQRSRFFIFQSPGSAWKITAAAGIRQAHDSPLQSRSQNEEVASNGRKAIIFSQWTRMLDLTEPALERLKLGWGKLTGGVPSKKRGALIEQFFEDPQCKVFLSTDACGVGLNLQAASMVVNLDLPWNPAVLAQRIARAHRHGQRHTVNVVSRVPTDLAARVDRVRALTAPPAEDEEEAPPPSVEAAGGFIATVQELIDLGRELVAQEML